MLLLILAILDKKLSDSLSSKTDKILSHSCFTVILRPFSINLKRIFEKIFFNIIIMRKFNKTFI